MGGALAAVRTWSTLAAAGVAFTADGGTLRARKPGGLSAEECELIRLYKPRLLAMAAMPPDSLGDGSYYWLLGRLAQAGDGEAFGAWEALVAVMELEATDERAAGATDGAVGVATATGSGE